MHLSAMSTCHRRTQTTSKTKSRSRPKQAALASILRRTGRTSALSTTAISATCAQKSTMAILAVTVLSIYWRSSSISGGPRSIEWMKSNNGSSRIFRRRRSWWRSWSSRTSMLLCWTAEIWYSRTRRFESTWTATWQMWFCSARRGWSAMWSRLRWTSQKLSKGSKSFSKQWAWSTSLVSICLRFQKLILMLWKHNAQNNHIEGPN